MIAAYIGLGGNQGDTQSNLRMALKLIDDNQKCKVIKCSSWYCSKALTLDDEEQADYLNAVCEISTELDAEALLDLLQSIEHELGRVREKRWGARTVDLDILLYGNTDINSERLTVPHPQMQHRNFVILPLLEINSELEIPSIGSLKVLAKALGWEGLQRLNEETL
ncbi:2-amino-4-hydroxy-6-hydroxymethyldihydropteridine diphosphokinase [Pseudoteredinibacter isoporae]|uniref:2-amino-4-hydroxy-6-hydroxymethyldihydropteridine pyrophosphokinase n=1 Tax=Pseudoteredinibacter isoporae TaxID=570281 RepID=A0A7X0JWF7_9GAMM|nr:2-amino-4-hydroxy-6-hydroxymethyldihydropteridine diphosphokinase [Pseudoteredinibacter isoporae]MBB6522983.1 2-amino-4-hydroxy-6-hydroxymethyldihydropteridine diphosphokinase [Pseudoteredinibacter isoporae]NHO88507.1 2-amino-4-hydroxy-6-hydroxymethyldihydropteridine diphosphokinase [Pseudoteredinibacter isoporae]NIB22094.1 2-amino-4-hydroxy-6-hydroxymethyldihydropteridine diphosphokinase [Pseudoteredinibacter isoporae]